MNPSKQRALRCMAGSTLTASMGTYAYVAVVLAQSLLLQSKGFSVAQFSVFFSCYSSGSLLANMILSRAVKPGSIRLIAIAGAFGPIVTLGGLALSNNVFLTYLMGIVGGTLNNLVGYTLKAILTGAWLNQGRGKITGLFGSVGSFIGLFINPLMGTVIGSLGAVNGLLALGMGFSAVMLFIGVFLIQNLPEYYGLEAANFEPGKNKARNHRPVDVGPSLQMPDRKLFSVPVTYIYLAIIVIFSLVCTMYSNYQSSIFEDVFSINVTQTSYCMSVGSFVGMFGTTLYGLLVDRFGARKTFFALCLWVFAVFTFLPLTLSGMIGAVIFSALGIVYQMQLMVPSLLVPAVFGNKGAVIQPYGGFISSVAGIVAAPVAAGIYSSTGSYLAILLTFGVAFLIAGILILACTSEKSKQKFLEADRRFTSAS